jgi:SAM-dependent methyltransferase
VITAEELARLRGPSIDPAGITFVREGHILRAFRGEAADVVARLLQSPGLPVIVEAGLVPFRSSELRVEGMDIVVESDRLPVVSYPQEWPTALLLEAGRMIARLGRALAEHGFTLADAHPWNVLFDGTRPVWVDLGAIVPARPVTDAWVAEYRRHIAMPLALRSAGLHGVADQVWKDHPGTGPKHALDWRPIREVFPWGYAGLARGPREPDVFFDRLVRYTRRIRPRSRPTQWSRYVQAPGVKPGDATNYDPKQHAVDTFLRGCPDGPVLDVGANAGWFSELAAHHGHLVVALDTDDVTLSGLFQRAAERRQPITPLRMDVMWPLGSHGLALAHADAPTRLRMPTTMWLAVLHHLVGRQGFSFELVAQTIDRFTGELAIVEFIPRDDEHVRTWSVAAEPWYDADTFIAAMRPFFPNVETLPSSPAPRSMLAFRRAP